MEPNLSLDRCWTFSLCRIASFSYVLSDDVLYNMYISLILNSAVLNLEHCLLEHCLLEHFPYPSVNYYDEHKLVAPCSVLRAPCSVLRAPCAVRT